MERSRLSDIVHAKLEPFADRVRIEGAEVTLAPAEVQSLSLALHELATNAAKYGALSVPDGEVEVRWSVSCNEGPLLQFEWRERDGPAVAAPSREGFGSSLLRSVFLRSRLDFAMEGVSWRIDVPLDKQPPAS